ncbi:DMT family transporter [Kineococcus sp. NUM-3379]
MTAVPAHPGAVVDTAPGPGAPRTGRTGTATGVLAALFSVIVWGAMFRVSAGMLDAIDPFHLTLIRYGTAAVPFTALLVWREGWSALRFEGRFAHLVVLGGAGFAGFNFLVYLGLQSSRPQNAAIMMATFPLLTSVVVWLRFRHRPSRATTVAGLAAVAGALLVITRGHPSSLVDILGRGDVLILAGVLCWVVYTMGPADLPGLSPLRYTTLAVLAGLLPVAAGTAVATWAGLATTPGGAELRAHPAQLLYMVLLAAVLATRSWSSASRILGAHDTALFMNLVPVTAFTVEIALGYRPSPLEITGGLLVLGALLAHNLHGRRRPDPQVTTERGHPPRRDPSPRP